MNSQLDLFSEIVASAPAFLNGLNEQQQAAVQAPAHQALQVLAGAGTGKTELISRRFVKLVHELRAKNSACPEERILVVTFTSDAAMNMRLRIQQRLLENGEEGLSRDAWISTFHQFCLRLLRTHALEAALPPNFVMLNPLEQQVLFQRIIQNILTDNSKDIQSVLARFALPLSSNVLLLERLIQLGIDDLESLLNTDNLYRVINRIKTSGLSPKEFLEIATKQAQQLTECLKNLPVPHDKDLDKVENMALKIMAWKDVFQPWAHTSWEPIQAATEKAERSGKKMTASTLKDELKNLLKLYLADRTFEPIMPELSILDEVLLQEIQVIQIIAAIYALYQDALLQQGACDFDDLINHSIQLLSTKPHLRARYQQQFEAMIVDEFQDSNGSQLRLLELLMREKASNLTVVGDEKQSIYAFRFAQPENLDLIFRNSQLTRINLQTNYRSRPPVLAVANHLTEQITLRSNQTLQASEKNEVFLEPKVTWVSLDTMDEDENGKQSHRAVDEQKEKEAQFIAIEIARLIAKENYYFSDIVVLVKSHTRAEAIQRALVDLNIPSVRQKNLGFFQEPVIKDAMALLHLMRNVHDELPLVRILQQKLNQRTLYRLLETKRLLKAEQPNISLFEVCLRLAGQPDSIPGISTSLAQAIGALTMKLRELYKLKNRLTPVHLFLKLAQQVGIIKPNTPAWQQKQQRITLRMFEKLLYLLNQSQILQPTLDEVLDTLEQYVNHPEQELPVKAELSGEDAVQIMTVFAAKGLEFKVVFSAYTEKARVSGTDQSTILFDPQYAGKAGFGLILGKVNGRPNVKREVYQKCWQAPRGKTEAQRVFYVALTRAMERLYVIRGSQSFDWTKPDEYPRSAVNILSEADDVEWLDANVWEIDTESLRQKMAVVQEQARLQSKSERV